MERELLVRLQVERRHVLAAVAGLSEADLQRAVVPSGWTIAGLLNHLTFDDELFWIGAVLGADESSIAALRNGWLAPVASGAQVIAAYRAQVERSDEILAGVDLAAPPSWWPPPAVFDSPAFADGYQVLFRVLVETATHAGHLDIVRELIDGHQHLVLD